MGYVLAIEPLVQGGQGLAALVDNPEMISASPTEVILALPDGIELTLQGRDFRYSEAGDLLGGSLENFYFLDGHHPLLVADHFDLSLAAMLGFLADGRPAELSAYVFHGADTVEGSYGDDLIAGFGGDDEISGNGGNDAIDGGDGSDALAGWAGDDLIFGRGGNDLIEGGDGNDFMSGNVGLDTIAGGAGDDTIYGGRDYDVMYGDDGNDLIHGDLGGDDFWGGAGNDTLIGGSDDYDWFYFSSGSGQDRIEDFDIAQGDLIQIERHLNNTDIVDFETLVDRVASDFHGDTIVDLGGGHYIRLVGVDADAVDERYFSFFDRGAFDPAPAA